jgi:murein L,D-transpeptidase YcbB/YkuD
MTVTVGEDGKAHFWRDIYDRTDGMAQVEKYAALGKPADTDDTNSDERG